MAGGYMGRILFVNLSTGEIAEETPEESLYQDFIGGYGVGARVLYSRQKGGVNPLGPGNTLGFLTGPLTGTSAVAASRYVVVGKSPLTGAWGEANSGGFFGPSLKFAGYDGVFFTGVSPRPVYLLLDDGKAELRDASHLWGKDVFETQDMLKAELGKTVESACIGPSGEKLSLISCVVTGNGAAAGRRGLGAVMGSKKLKAVAARGTQKVPVAHSGVVDRLRREHMADFRTPGPTGESPWDRRHKYGTGGTADLSAHSGDSPVKNWGGVGIVDFPDVSSLSGDVVVAQVVSRGGCWRCPIACEGKLKAGTGEYPYPEGTRRAEYETLSSFGSLCLNNNLEAINMATHLCNIYGLDTISAGAVIAFAMECYENRIINIEDTDGIELTWGNPRAMIAMTEKVAKREGFGDVLADGVRVAAHKIGREAEEYAVHIGGQEPGMHDQKLVRRPGSPSPVPFTHVHTFGPGTFQRHVTESAGLCSFGYGIPDPGKYIAGFLSAVTGWERPMNELLKTGERIDNMMHVFDLREGINPLEWDINPRAVGIPPQKVGPLAGVTLDHKARLNWNLGALDWDLQTTKPSKQKLLALGLNDVAKELWS
ncbi:MAG: aldehyde ferredoxin oxidoreductase family protein [Chloroflexi bacterium]|nr:aldehyde ferredoxin oxidoreductase family protein [Chloroflexota bacterium]